jgi:hypothetical protein
MASDPPRPLWQRKQDALARLHNDVDAWVASADSDGRVYLVPQSFLWDGQTVTLATPQSSRTGRNLRSAGRARLAIGPTRDVVLIDGMVEVFTTETVPADLASAFAEKPLGSAQRSGQLRLLPHHASPDPGMAGRKRTRRPGPHAPRQPAGLSRPGSEQSGPTPRTNGAPR